MTRSTLILSRLGAACYIAWGVFHFKVAHDIYILGAGQAGIVQGRTYQLAAYIFTLALFAILVGAFGNWRNSLRAYWLNLSAIGWADGIWVVVVVLPGYVPLLRGLFPPAIFILGALFTTLARRNENDRLRLRIGEEQII